MKKRLIAVAVLVLLALVAWIAWRALRPEEDEGILRATGTVEATEAALGFETAGRLEAVAVEEGDEVAAGSVLARLDTGDLEARRAEATARVAAAEARLRQLESGSRRQEIEQARAAVDGAAEEVEERRREHARTETLYAGGAVAREELERSSTAVEVAASRLAEARARLDLVREGPPREEIEAQRALLQEAVAGVASIDTRLADAVLEAPLGGLVASKHRTAGETVSPGAPVVTLLDLGDRWVRVYVPEDRLGALRIGRRVRIESDTFPDRGYEGEISYLASQAEFTPKSVQTEEERVRLVYEVKVRITGDEEHELKPGMPVDVEFELTGSTGSTASDPEAAG